MMKVWYKKEGDSNPFIFSPESSTVNYPDYNFFLSDVPTDNNVFLYLIDWSEPSSPVLVRDPNADNIRNELARRDNKEKARNAQIDIINSLQENQLQINYNLPPTLATNQIEHLKDQLQTLQHAIDNPSTDPDWQPHEVEHYPPWNSETHYQIGDVVSHNSAIWRATSNNSNNEPDDVPGDWEKIE